MALNVTSANRLSAHRQEYFDRLVAHIQVKDAMLSYHLRAKLLIIYSTSAPRRSFETAPVGFWVLCLDPWINGRNYGSKQSRNSWDKHDWKGNGTRNQIKKTSSSTSSSRSSNCLSRTHRKGKDNLRRLLSTISSTSMEEIIRRLKEVYQTDCNLFPSSLDLRGKGSTWDISNVTPYALQETIEGIDEPTHAECKRTLAIVREKLYCLTSQRMSPTTLNLWYSLTIKLNRRDRWDIATFRDTNSTLRNHRPYSPSVLILLPSMNAIPAVLD